MQRWERREAKRQAIKRRMPKHGAGNRLLNRLAIERGAAKQT